MNTYIHVHIPLILLGIYMGNAKNAHLIILILPNEHSNHRGISDYIYLQSIVLINH